MIEVEASLLRDLLRAVIPAMGVDVNLPRFMQVRVHSEGGVLSLTATDGARIHHVCASGQRTVMPKTEWLVGSSVDEALRACVEMAKRRKGDTWVTLGEDTLVVHAGHDVMVKLGIRTESFPDFERVLHDMVVSPGQLVVHATQHLRDAFEAAMQIAPSCTLIFGENRSGSSRVTKVLAVGDDKKGVRRELVCMISASKQ